MGKDDFAHPTLTHHPLALTSQSLLSSLTSSPMKKRWLITWVLILAIFALGGWKLNELRLEAGGVHNLVSRAWWIDHLNGDDLFNHQTRFFKRGNRAYKEVCLTFDDGPHPQSCGLIADTLKRYGAHATFFLVGKRIKEHPELARLLLADGFEVGNHTQDHLRLDTLKPNQVKNELVNCEVNFKRATGQKMYLFRPPGMRFNDDVMATIKGLGYVTVGWDVGAKDFAGANLKGQQQSPELIAHSVIKQLDDGVIILLHDNPETAEALPQILETLKSDGYKALNVSESMARLPKPVLVQTNAHAGA